MEERKLIREKIKIVEEMVEKTENRLSAETLEVLFNRHLSEIGKKQRQMEKMKETFKPLLDSNINGNESQ